VEVPDLGHPVGAVHHPSDAQTPTVQGRAVRYNAVQFSAGQYSTLQYTSLHEITLQCTASHYNFLFSLLFSSLYFTTHSTVQYFMIYYNAVH
jgi:hypothetical protein